MHICPQEIMAVIQAVEILRPSFGVIKYWCEACYKGIHKTCEDHETDKSLAKAHTAHD